MRLDIFLLEDAGTVASLRVYLLVSNPLLCAEVRLTAAYRQHSPPPFSISEESLSLAGHPDFSFPSRTWFPTPSPSHA
jgi:hypothetical protein